MVDESPETSLGEDSNLENVSLCTYLSDVSWYVCVRCTDPPSKNYDMLFDFNTKQHL